MCATGDDVANRAVVAALNTASLDLVELSVWGDRKAVDKALDGLKLHPRGAAADISISQEVGPIP
jgi:hypothetical protein